MLCAIIGAYVWDTPAASRIFGHSPVVEAEMKRKVFACHMAENDNDK